MEPKLILSNQQIIAIMGDTGKWKYDDEDATATSGHFTYIWRSGDNWHFDSTWSSTTIVTEYRKLNT